VRLGLCCSGSDRSGDFSMSGKLDDFWLRRVDRALNSFKTGDFAACYSSLNEALDAIETIPEKSDNWRLLSSLRAGDNFLNGIIKDFYAASAEAQIKYFDLLMLVAQKGRYSGMHQASFTLGRLFEMSADWYKNGYEEHSRQLVEVAFAQLASSFGAEDACSKLDKFGVMVGEIPAFTKALKASVKSTN